MPSNPRNHQYLFPFRGNQASPTPLRAEMFYIAKSMPGPPSSVAATTPLQQRLLLLLLLSISSGKSHDYWKRVSDPFLLRIERMERSVLLIASSLSLSLSLSLFSTIFLDIEECIEMEERDSLYRRVYLFGITAVFKSLVHSVSKQMVALISMIFKVCLRFLFIYSCILYIFLRLILYFKRLHGIAIFLSIPRFNIDESKWRWEFSIWRGILWSETNNSNSSFLSILCFNIDR